MWRRGKFLGLLIMALALSIDSEENAPKTMEPDLKFSFNLDKTTSLNLGVRKPTEFEYITNKKRYINQYVIWLNMAF